MFLSFCHLQTCEVGHEKKRTSHHFRYEGQLCLLSTLLVDAHCHLMLDESTRVDVFDVNFQENRAPKVG